jgi:hypothetical protein
MSRTILLGVSVSACSKPVLPSEVVALLEAAGWSCVFQGAVNYLPLGDNGDYEWISSELTSDQMTKILESKEKQKETAGVDLYWKDSDIGVVFHMFKENHLSFGLQINTKYIDEKEYLIDYNWYAERIIPAIRKEYGVEAYEFQFVY